MKGFFVGMIKIDPNIMKADLLNKYMILENISFVYNEYYHA